MFIHRVSFPITEIQIFQFKVFWFHTQLNEYWLWFQFLLRLLLNLTEHLANVLWCRSLVCRIQPQETKTQKNTKILPISALAWVLFWEHTHTHTQMAKRCSKGTTNSSARTQCFFCGFAFFCSFFDELTFFLKRFTFFRVFFLGNFTFFFLNAKILKGFISWKLRFFRIFVTKVKISRGFFWSWKLRYP